MAFVFICTVLCIQFSHANNLNEKIRFYDDALNSQSQIWSRSDLVAILKVYHPLTAVCKRGITDLNSLSMIGLAFQS